MERDQLRKCAFALYSYFNSHAHVERDSYARNIMTNHAISTHTLTWSVTFFIWQHLFQFVISTHTLTWSVTLGDRYALTAVYISTHTLTWSVTISHLSGVAVTPFQLTRSRGA